MLRIEQLHLHELRGECLLSPEPRGPPHNREPCIHHHLSPPHLQQPHDWPHVKRITDFLYYVRIEMVIFWLYWGKSNIVLKLNLLISS